MGFRSLKNNPYFKGSTGMYFIILAIFIIWMLFLDGNSYLTHREFNKEIEELETWIKYHKQKIAKDKETIQKLKDSSKLEKYAREKYLMKKENEDIYIIEFDTIKE
jgi:cell division protein FtsB